MDTVFSILGDNEIDEEEYTTVYQAYGINKDNCITAFKKISGVSITSFMEISGVRFLTYGINKDNCITAFNKIPGVRITVFKEISGVRTLYLWYTQR